MTYIEFDVGAIPYQPHHRVQSTPLDDFMWDRLVLAQINDDHEFQRVDQILFVEVVVHHCEVFDHSLECLLSDVGCKHGLVVSLETVETSAAEQFLENTVCLLRDDLN